ALANGDVAAAAVDGDLVGEFESTSDDGMLLLPPDRSGVEMSYLVVPGGRMTVTLPPSAGMVRVCGTWGNVRGKAPAPGCMATTGEVTPLASTLPPTVESWRSPVRPLALRSPPPVSTRVVPVPAQLSALTLPPSVSTWRAPVSPLALRSPPPVSS